MRTAVIPTREFAHQGEEFARSNKEARELMPWAARVVKVCGGWKGFESVSDYIAWKRKR